MITTFTFTKAVKAQEKLRMALDGPPGSGKTWTSLIIGTFLAEKEGGRIAVIDSERSSAKKYASDFDFDHLTLPNADPRSYTGAIDAAAKAGYAVIIIDSLSHAWDGTLDLKDAVAKRSKSNDGFGAWREVTPIHNDLIDTMLRAPAHVIATLRTKMEYLVEKNELTGKSRVAKVGLKPVQRDGVDYEFDIVGDMDQENTLAITKSRCFALAGAVVNRPGTELAEALWNWLQDGESAITAEQVEKLRSCLSGIVDDEVRNAAKRVFKDAYGAPTAIVLSQFDDALAFAMELAAASAESEAPPQVTAPDQPPCEDDAAPIEQGLPLDGDGKPYAAAAPRPF